MARNPLSREGPTTGRHSPFPRWITEVPYWAISAVIHVVILLIVAGWILREPRPPRREPKTIVVGRTLRPPRYHSERAVEPRPLIPAQKISPRWELNPTIAEVATAPRILPRERALELSEQSIGIGRPTYAHRTGKGNLVDEGGSAATEDAVLAALRWLARHQASDGHWSGRDFVDECADGRNPCRNEHPDRAYTDGRGDPEYDVGITALAMLAYLGYGHTHRTGEHRDFRRLMKNAMKWMLGQQVECDDPRVNGRYGPDAGKWIYNHALATMAMAELLAISRDRFELSKSVRAATELCLRRQNPELGWRYRFREGNDSSVTGWMVLALKASRVCSQIRLISIRPERYEPSFASALRWFALTTSTAGKTGYLAPGDPGAGLRGVYPEPYPFQKEGLSCMTAVAVLSRLFAGTSRKHASIRQGVGILKKELPLWRTASGRRKSKINFYYWYYASYALFQYGGRAWRDWNSALQTALLPSQRVSGCEDGSWDPIGEWGAVGGRVYSTAIGAMTLEVYYRFVRTTTR